MLERIIRFKPYTLSEREEEILAMQGEMAQAASKAFRQLLDADLKFGLVKNEKGEQVELSNSTFSKLLVSPDRGVRKAAFHQYYEQFAGHENTLAATLTGSIHKDVYYAKVRGFKVVARIGSVSRQRAAIGVRQPDRRRPQEPAGRASLLRRAAAEDEAQRYSSIRHLCADPQRPGNKTPLEARR